MKHLCKYEKFNEDTSSTGGPVSGGMGAVVSAQPSGLAGQTIGLNWASQGGTTGSGDVSAPYNPGGSNRVFQQVPMGRGHGPRTGKKSRNKKIDLKSLKSMMKRDKEDIGDEKTSKPRVSKVMNFNDFLKNDFTTIKK